MVVSLYRSPFTVCRCCSRFFGSFITHTLYAALERYTDIVVLVFNDFGHGFAVFGDFCCSFEVFTTPHAPLLTVAWFILIGDQKLQEFSRVVGLFFQNLNPDFLSWWKQ